MYDTLNVSLIHVFDIEFLFNYCMITKYLASTFMGLTYQVDGIYASARPAVYHVCTSQPNTDKYDYYRASMLHTWLIPI